jgi:hypothetical protein
MGVEPEVAAALPDYTVEREIGRGGMGIVFLGQHARLGRRVAIKELPPSFAHDPGVRERFSTEARTLAALTHPHIVPIYDYVERDGLCLIVMEELPGGTVWDRFTTTGLLPPTACAIVMACCAALQHAHDQRVLHLDMKPDNLMFASNAAIKVTDFGISRVVSGDRTLGTVDGQVLGTPAYMSPEQARGDDLTPASDVYSTGIVLYELLSGHLPWTGAETATDLLLKRLREAPAPLRDVAPHVPEALADAVMKAIEREPADRWATAEEFGVAIGRACAESWGPEWLDSAGVSIIGSERLSVAARTSSRRPIVDPPGPRVTGTGAAAPMTVTGETPASGRAGETVVGDAVSAPGAAAPRTVAADAAAPAGARPATEATPAPVSEAPAPAPALPHFEPVRAAGSEPRIEGADLNRLDRSAFVDVADMIAQPPRPRIPILIAVALFAAAIVVGASLFAAPEHAGGLKPGDVSLGGVDVAAAGRVRLDLAHDLPVQVGKNMAVFADRAKLRLSSAGVPLGVTTADLEGGGGTLDTGALRYLAAGSVTAEVSLHGGDATIAKERFPARVARGWYLTAFGVGSLLLLLAGLAYLESGIRPLRRGRRRASSYVACAISAAVAAVGAAGVAAALGRADLTTGGLGALAALSAAGGVSLAEAVRRSALRKGVRRAVRRAERAFAGG